MNSTSPEGKDERMLMNLSQKIVVLPSSMISTGKEVVNFKVESVALIVKILFSAIINMFERKKEAK